MGKRSDFPRIDKDCYDTPLQAVWPLRRFLSGFTTYIEPCAGKGALIACLKAIRPDMVCEWACDLEPRAGGIQAMDALSSEFSGVIRGGVPIITNPPWSRDVLHPMIERFTDLGPCWLLFDAAWAMTEQAGPYLTWCTDIVAVGRVKWIEGTRYAGKDDAAWYRFDPYARAHPVPRGPELHGLLPRAERHGWKALLAQPVAKPAATPSLQVVA